MSAWFSYFARNYIGLTQFEQDHGADAFIPEADAGRLVLRRTRSITIASNNTLTATNIAESAEFGQNSSHSSDASIGLLHTSFVTADPRQSTSTTNTTLESDLTSARQSTITWESELFLQRWEKDIVSPPRFAIEFWNVFNRAKDALERTNNEMEAAHGQFARDLNHHPVLSDFLTAFIKDVDKQRDIARAEILQKSRRREPRYVIKEQKVIQILNDANFDTNEGLKNAIHLLGVVMQGYVDGLRVRRDEESDTEQSSEEENDA